MYAISRTLLTLYCYNKIRVPTSAWVNELEKIIPTPDELDSLEVTTQETAASLVEGMRMALNRALEMELEVYHHPDNPDSEMQLEVMGRAIDEFFVKVKSLLSMHGSSFGDIMVSMQSGDVFEFAENFSTVDEVSLVEFANFLRDNPRKLQYRYHKIYAASKYSIQDELQDLISKVNTEEIVANDKESCVKSVRDVVAAFVVHIECSHMERLNIADIALVESSKDISSNDMLSATDLLLKRYEHSAESLLMMRCGKCDKSVSLFYSSKNGREAPSGMEERQDALNNLLSPFNEEEQITVLRAFVAFSSASISASTFVSSLFCVWVNLQPPSVVKMIDAGVLHDLLGSFMRSVIVLLVDIERRLAAQLALYRVYPKVYTACCGSAHCFMCKIKGHHADKTCEEVQSALVGEEAQYCPGCGVPTLRTEGCHQILCVCGMSWQWKGGDDPNDVNYNFDDGGEDSFDDDDDSDSFDDISDSGSDLSTSDSESASSNDDEMDDL